MNDKVFIRINGIGHAFSRELGCTCARCTVVNFAMEKPPQKLETFRGWDDPPWRAHTSGSILIPDPDHDNKVKHHILIDVGAGVVDSLMCSGLEGLDQVDALLITHWHPDHVLGLNQFCESMKRSAKSRSRTFQKIPLFCTLETYEQLRENGGQAYVLQNHLALREILPEQPFELGTNPIVRFTPIPVAHSGIKGSVIFVAEIGLKKKVVFAWDIDVPGKELPSGGITNREIFHRNGTLFKNTQILFIAANTWTADEIENGGRKKTGHSSYQRAKFYIELIEAKTVFLVHMSGHEDGVGNRGYGWTDSDWESEVTKDKVLISRQGMVIEV